MPYEDWDENTHFLSLKKIIIIALITMLSIGGAFALYKITSPNSPPVTVNTPATLSTPTVNATSVAVGEWIQLTTTLSDHAEGLQVFFFENTTNIGSAYTDSNGQAILNRQMNVVGSYVFRAECMHP